MGDDISGSGNCAADSDGRTTGKDSPRTVTHRGIAADISPDVVALDNDVAARDVHRDAFVISGDDIARSWRRSANRRSIYVHVDADVISYQYLSSRIRAD